MALTGSGFLDNRMAADFLRYGRAISPIIAPISAKDLPSFRPFRISVEVKVVFIPCSVSAGEMFAILTSRCPVQGWNFFQLSSYCIVTIDAAGKQTKNARKNGMEARLDPLPCKQIRQICLSRFCLAPVVLFIIPQLVQLPCRRINNDLLKMSFCAMIISDLYFCIFCAHLLGRFGIFEILEQEIIAELPSPVITKDDVKAYLDSAGIEDVSKERYSFG